MIFKLNPEKYRKDFPILEKNVIYFDNACMTLKPKQVVEAMEKYYKYFPACAGRSAHRLAKEVEHEVDKARDTVRSFINAKRSEEVIFTRNTTEGLNLVANSIGLKKGDEVIITDKEHNSNHIPWLRLKKKGIMLKVVPSRKDNTFDLDAFKELLTEKTKLVSVVHVSNLDGVENPVQKIAQLAHEKGALVMVDGAQSAPHKIIDVRKLDVDFFSFSGHKMCGPTGIGALYGKKDVLERMDQFLLGGETVIDSTYENYEPEHLPMKFEAGLQDYAGIIGFGAACAYLQKIGLKKIAKHEIKLNKMLSEQLLKNEKIELIGPEDPEKRGGIFSFNIKGMDPHHVAKMLDASKGICMRSGAHCVHSWFNKHNMKGSARASLYFYNTEEEVQAFIDEIQKISEF